MSPKGPKGEGKRGGGGKRQKAESSPHAVTPTEWVLTERQATNLAIRTDLAPDELAGKSVLDITELVRWRLDPELLLFRRVCGRVVKRDPATGELHGVPNATVHVEDTDCSFLGFFPAEWPFGWLYPFGCRREVIATVRTDECGRFCVFVPRWEIDRILRFRRVRVCLPELVRPRIRDLLEEIRVLPEFPRPPRPPGDPPFFRIEEPGAADRVREVAGGRVADALLETADAVAFDESSRRTRELLEAPVPRVAFTPPLGGPGHRERLVSEADFASMAPDSPASRVALLEAVAERIPMSLEEIRAIDPHDWIGPVLRCRDVIVPEWVTVFDVPDVTFRVTQDVDGDGDEETIYSEGFFDVRWNADPVPDVMLEASGSALASPSCEGPDIDPGACQEPTIVTAGLMPLTADYHDGGSGYAIRPNRPRPGGLATSPLAPIGGPPPTETPFLGTLQLHGCHRFEGAQFYRLVYAYEGAGEVPFTGLEWHAPRLGAGAPIHVAPDSDGWYAVLPAGDLVFPHWLLNWNTRRFPNGLYRVRLQLGDGSKAVIDQSDPVRFVVDNSRPSALFTEIRWRPAGDAGPGTLVSPVCAVIERPPVAIELVVKWVASADHFRDVRVVANGCGSGGVTRIGPAPDFEHWHTDPGDNSYAATAVFRIGPPPPGPGSAPDGAYTVRILARGRAFNPAGFDAGPESDWDYEPVYAHFYPARHICVITA